MTYSFSSSRNYCSSSFDENLSLPSSYRKDHHLADRSRQTGCEAGAQSHGSLEDCQAAETLPRVSLQAASSMCLFRILDVQQSSCISARETQSLARIKAYSNNWQNSRFTQTIQGRQNSTQHRIQNNKQHTEFKTTNNRVGDDKKG